MAVTLPAMSDVNWTPNVTDAVSESLGVEGTTFVFQRDEALTGTVSAAANRVPTVSKRLIFRFKISFLVDLPDRPQTRCPSKI